MKKALPAIVLSVLFIYCCHPAAGQRAAAGQHSLPDANQKSLNNQLLDAASNGQSDKIVSLLKQGANIEANDKYGYTPLMLAVDGNRPDAVKLLVERGANVKAKNTSSNAKLGETALFFARTADVAQLLIGKGADADARDHDGETPLFNAAFFGFTEVAKVLLENGANIEARSEKGATALQMGIYWGRAEMVKLLLDRGADIEATNFQGNTALFVAVYARNDAMIDLLLSRGANIEAKNPIGDTALLMTTFLNMTDTVRLLLERGSDIEATDSSGDTALISAARKNEIDIIKSLLKMGADIEARNKKGETALDIANRDNSVAIADLIEQTVRKRKQLEEAQAKDPRNIFAAGLSAFQQSPKDESLREKVIQLSLNLPNPQPIPEEARQLFTLATDQIKQAGTPAALDQPIALLRKALEIAPWWGNAYYNLSRTLELRGQYDDAAMQLNYYLELKPAEADAQQARAHLVVIQTEKDAAAKQ